MIYTTWDLPALAVCVTKHLQLSAQINIASPALNFYPCKRLFSTISPDWPGDMITESQNVRGWKRPLWVI